MVKEYHTYKEIITQVKIWERVFTEVVYTKDFLGLGILSNNYDEIIFFGCGSSYNLSQSASFFTKLLLNKVNCLALPSSELLINTDVYIKKEKKYLVVGFSRSGETTESINVIKLFKNRNNVKSYIFTCKKDSSISKFSDSIYICKGVIEKSIAMTASFSSMLFAYCLILVELLGNKEMLNEFKYLIQYLNENISIIENSIQNYLNNNDFKSFFVLGSGFNYGLAVEADLKMKEMSQIPSFSYHFYEFNHGPKSLITEESLCLILTLSRDMFKNKEIMKEILKLGSKVFVVDTKNVEITDKSDNLFILFQKPNFEFDPIRSFINIPVFQMLAYTKTIMNNLNPDKPKNLNYAIKL